ncbi:two-component system response regulator [ANME-1 cluster archaeon GoMg4]|nr:two-component system response regulator [ANME-1 cluster archaeon GoMg4]
MKYTILLVDDDEAIHKLIPSFLERRVRRHTFTLHSAKNGAEGVEMYGKLARDGQKPDLVIMDLRMPVMDGAEATKRIIENDPKANIYLFTAYAGTEIESEARKEGAKGTITKGADWYWTADSIVIILES